MIALSTGSLYTYGTARVFELAAKAGYDSIEVLTDHRWDSRQSGYLRRLSADHGLPIAVVHSPFALEVADWPAGGLERIEKLEQLRVLERGRRIKVGLVDEPVVQFP